MIKDTIYSRAGNDRLNKIRISLYQLLKKINTANFLANIYLCLQINFNDYMITISYKINRGDWSSDFLVNCIKI